MKILWVICCSLILIALFDCNKGLSDSKVLITVTSNAGGTVTPKGVSELNKGDSLIYVIKSDDSHIILKVKINGIEIPVANPFEITYDFNAVLSDMSMEVVFAAAEDYNYLPFTIGAKNKYQFDASYGYRNESSREKGECTWKFISMSVDSVCRIEQSLNGYRLHSIDYWDHKDSSRIENQISILNFNLLGKGKVVFTFPVPDMGSGTVTFKRLVVSDKIDTCFILSTFDAVCLRKNIGITHLGYSFRGNHTAFVSYSLIEGPTY